MNKVSFSDKFQFVKDNYYLLGPKEISKAIGCSRSTVLRIAKKLKMNVSLSFVKEHLQSSTQLRNDPLYKNLYNLKDREVTYILGFLWADGHIVVDAKGSYSLICSISKKDSTHIQKIFFKKAPWKERFFQQKLNGKNFDIYRIAIHNKTLVKWLESLDFHKKTLVFPSKIIKKLNKKCLSTFIAGYFDGDGSFYFNEKGVYRTRIAGNYCSDTSSWIDFFAQYGIVCTTQRRTSKKGHRSANLDIHDIESNRNFIQAFIEPNKDLILPRKMVKFEQFTNHIFGRKDWSKIPRKALKLSNEIETLQFSSAFEAAKYLNVSRSSVSDALYKGHKCKGFKVEYLKVALDNQLEIEV